MKKAFIIGIAGATQSGKSTFTKDLENSLQDIKYKTFHIDDYHKPKQEQPIVEAPITKKSYTDFNSLDSFNLSELRLDLKNEIERNQVDLILIEGTLILYDSEIHDLLDLKIFVDTRPDERAIRYIELYSKHHGHEFIKNSYLDLVRYRMDEYIEPTKWKADLIINGSKKSIYAVEIIKTHIIERIKKDNI